MGIINSLLTTYKGLDTQGILLGSRPYKPIFYVRGASQKIFVKHLRNLSNSYDMNVNGATTPVDFYIAPPSSENWCIAEWKLQILDSKGFDVFGFASMGSPLANGIDCLIEIDGIQTSILDYTIKTNSDISALAYDTRLDTYGNTDDSLVAKWSFYESGQNILLKGATNDKLIVRVQDDLTSLSKFLINTQGYIV